MCSYTHGLKVTQSPPFSDNINGDSRVGFPKKAIVYSMPSHIPKILLLHSH